MQILYLHEESYIQAVWTELEKIQFQIEDIMDVHSKLMDDREDYYERRIH